MELDLSFDCPHCGSPNFSPVDPVEGVQEWTTDCAVCCKPVDLRVRVRDGEIVEIDEPQGS